MSIEREIQKNYQEVFYPPMPEPQVETTPEAPMQLAEVGATKMADYGYSGQNQAIMTDYDPTMREKLSEFLQAGFEKFGMDRYKARKNAQTLLGGASSNLPLQGGIADIVPFLSTALQTQEAARSMIDSSESLKQGNYGTAALEAGFGVLGMLPGAAGTVKVAKKLPKNLPVGMSTKAIDGIESVFQPAKATAPASDIGFFSAVEQAALNIKRNSGTGQAMLNDITKGENVKADEIKWIGLDEFLKGKKNVTKQEVQEFIANNKVDVKEVTLGAPTEAPEIAAKRERFQQLSDKMEREDGLLPPDMAEMDKLQQELSTLPNPWLSDNEPKFGSYTLPGGDNYREILLTMPAKQRIVETAIPEAVRKPTVFKNSNGRFELLDEMGEVMSVHPTQEAADKAVQDWAKTFTKTETVTDPTYQSSHFDQPNILAHIRVNDRVDADGKKMLLVEEVQSDWHQAGRDKGYKKPLTKSEQERFDYFKKLDSDRPLTDAERAEYQPLAEKWVAQIKADVPDAPMKDTWYQLALKRVLKYAADNGYERVGLTTGKQQAERFDLSKQIDSIKFNKMPDGNIFWTAYKNGERAIGNDSSPSELASQVGKDLAKKIIEHEGPGEFSGIDLQVGGEGMKKYYDEIYPQFLSKYGKKWDAKVGQTTIEAEGKEPVRYIDITPEMRQSVSKGQPLFSATGLATGAGAGTMSTSQQEPK